MTFSVLTVIFFLWHAVAAFREPNEVINSLFAECCAVGDRTVIVCWQSFEMDYIQAHISA